MGSEEQGRYAFLKRTELILLMSGERDEPVPDRREAAIWRERFGRVTVVSPEPSLPGTVSFAHHIRAGREESRTACMNRMVISSQMKWVLFLVAGESIDWALDDGLSQMTRICWPPARIRSVTERGGWVQWFQIRLIPAGLSRPFEGESVPDATRYMMDHGITLSESVLTLDHNDSPYPAYGTLAEEAAGSLTPQARLATAENLIRRGRHAEASAHYRRVLKEEQLLPFDRLAAVNGLAASFAERQRWDKALLLTRESIDAEPMQILPRLIRYRIFELRQEWQLAFGEFREAERMMHRISRAGFDRMPDRERTSEIWIRLAIRAGVPDEALIYLQRLSATNRSKLPGELLRKLLHIAIVAGDRDRAGMLFQLLYGDLNLVLEEESLRREMDDTLTLYMENRWYDDVTEICGGLCELEPDNREYRRRLIVALTRSNRMEQARELMAQGV